MKAHQRIIRDQKAKEKPLLLFSDKPSVIDIKTAFVKSVSFETAKKIILEYEWLGTMGTTQHHFGIYFDGHCAGVVCFGYFQAMNTNSGGHPYAPYIGEKYSKYGIQLSRGACVHWAHPHSASKLISGSLQHMKQKGYKYSIAFSDPMAGEIGTVYQATNWHYLGFGKTIHYDIYYRGGQLYMNDRDFYKKYKFCGKNKTENWLNDKPDLYLKKREPKGRYVKLLGNKKENKEMMKHLKDKIVPYPKRIAVQDSRENRPDTIGEGLGQYQSTAQYLNDKNNIRMRQNA
tara:strand:- start:6 stop:869 length:864 start_codon:yes stop_codon:yes gene_type:complete